MNLGLQRLAILVSILLMSITGLSQKVLITNTRAESATQLMDLSWKRAANLVGADSEIIDHTYLDSLHILQTADVVILASGIEVTTNSQQNILQQYIQSGGHVYVQSEFKINFSGNQLFEHLVNKSGGEFEWIGETKSNLNPITFPSFVTESGEPVQLEYFWNGTYGCGGETVFPIATHNDLHYGFIHMNSDPTKGRIMTTTDQDWIKIATEVGKTYRLTLMKDLLNTLINGIKGLVTPDIRISFLQQSVCPNTPYNIEAKIDETVIDYQVDWYKNGSPQAALTNKVKFESNDLVDGDILQAKISMFAGCQSSAIESNIVQIERVYPLSMSTPSIIGNTMICAGDKGLFSASIDEMPDPATVTYQWTIDGVDQMINNDTISIDNPMNDSVLKLSVSFNDGCTMVQNSTESVTLQIIGKPIPTISLSQNKEKYCNLDIAQIELMGISEDYNYDITWNIDGQTNSDNTSAEYELPSLTNDHEVYATVTYDDPCQGQVRLSTPIASIIIDHPNLVITAKQNTSCERENGSITVAPEGGTAPFIYQWDDEPNVSNPIVNLPTGMHTIIVTDANGCTAEASTTIGAGSTEIIDSLVIMEQSCKSGELALVELFVNASFEDDLAIRWTDNEGNAVNGDFTEGEFDAGQYTVEAFVDENCSEKRQFEIKTDDQFDQIKNTFETEPEFFVTLDLEVDPSLIAEITWIGGDGILNCTDCTWPTFMATASQIFQVEIVSTGGCEYAFDVKVDVTTVEKLPYYAPSGFSPDGDNNNDQFEFFTDKTIASLQELLIFDRWGNLVYEAEDLETSVHWDGNLNGLPAERGVYVYVAKMLDIDGKDVMASGSISLFRK